LVFLLFLYYLLNVLTYLFDTIHSLKIKAMKKNMNSDVQPKEIPEKHQTWVILAIFLGSLSGLAYVLSNIG